jgi:hypothetical protein
MLRLQIMPSGHLHVGGETGLPDSIVPMVEIVSCVVNEFSVP